MNSKSTYTDLFLSAFANDVLFKYVFSDEDTQKSHQAQKWYFESIMHECLLHGGIDCTPDKLGAIAWVIGTNFPIHFTDEILSTLDNDIAAKISRFEKHEETVNQYIKNNAVNYGYICLLAVSEQARGRGYARQLINGAIGQMQAQGLEYCWLTTENPDNIAFYEKNGFTLINQATTGIGVVTYFFMQKI